MTIDLDALEKLADRITSALNDELWPELFDMEAAPNGLKALIAELKEARGLLKPFADRCDKSVRPDDSDSDGLTVQTRHLRAARAFLARNGKGEGPHTPRNATRGLSDEC